MGAISMADNYLGQIRKNNQGYDMMIVEYNTYDDIVVEFQNPYYRIPSKVSCFKKGTIINHNAPSVCGIGITGDKYPTSYKNGQHTTEYTRWMNILKRCYDDKHRYKNPAYYNVRVSEEWIYYTNFYEWLHSQENYDVLQDDCNIDKDILEKGNRIYAPDKCVLVPKRINNLLIKSDKIRGEYPVGVTYFKRNKKYVASCGGKKNHVYLGIYATAEEAFNVYKNYKESMIKRVAEEEYTAKRITSKCYNALLNYKVEIND